jgi:hypothetical protein
LTGVRELLREAAHAAWSAFPDPSLRGAPDFDAHQRIALLKALEGLLGIDRIDVPQEFLRLGRWQVASRLLADNTNAEMLRLKGVLPNIEQAIRKARRDDDVDLIERLPLASAAVYSGNNVRSFYPSTGYAAKIQGSVATSGNLKVDLDARALLFSAGFFNAPLIHCSGDVKGRTFLVEELIAGHNPNPSDHRILIDHLIPGMFRLYFNTGFSLVAPGPEMRVDEIIEDIASVAIPAHMVLERTCQLEMLRRLRASRGQMRLPMLAAFGHGDISRSNIILTRERHYRLVDWKYARVMPVAWDFRKLLMQIPGVQSALVPLIDAAMKGRGASGAMPAADQCLLAACARLAVRARVVRSRPPRMARALHRELLQFAVFLCLSR